LNLDEIGSFISNDKIAFLQFRNSGDASLLQEAVGANTFVLLVQSTKVMDLI